MAAFGHCGRLANPSASDLGKGLFMFERLFQRAVHSAARLLFGAALVMLLWGAAYAISLLGNFGMTGPSLAQQGGWVLATLSVVSMSFGPAAYLFFGAAVIHHLEVWLSERRKA